MSPRQQDRSWMIRQRRPFSLDISMGYKLYNPMTKKVIVSRDVTFAEDEEWQWNAAAEIDSKKNIFMF